MTSPVGAAYSRNVPLEDCDEWFAEYVAPDGAWKYFFRSGSTKMSRLRRWAKRRRTGTEAKAAFSRRLVSPKPDEGGSETQAEAQHPGKGRA